MSTMENPPETIRAEVTANSASGTAIVQRGSKVRIPKGTAVYFRQEIKPAGRTYTVTVDHVLPGFSGYCYCDHRPWREDPEDPAWVGWHSELCQLPRETTVRWAGSGGYWAEAPLDDVELIEDQP